MGKFTGRALNVIVAATVASGLLITAGYVTSAHGAKNVAKTSVHRTAFSNAFAGRKTLRLDYFVGTNGQLAGSLDPAQLTSAEDADTVQLVQLGMVAIGTDNKVQKSLASKIQISKNRKVFTFTIRKGAKFSNGDPVTAHDFVYSLNRALSKATASPVAYYDTLIKGYASYNAGKSSKLAGVVALNKSQLRVSISKPAPYFLKAFSYPNNDVLDPRIERGQNQTATNNYMTTHCPSDVGTGPFKFVCKGDSKGGYFYHSGTTPSYSFVPNPLYYGAKAHINIVMPAIKTAETGYAKYLAGELDVTGIPTDHLAQWSHSGSPQYHHAAAATIDYVSLNTKSAPFNNKDCRLAVAYGINRNAIAHILHNAVVPDYSIVPPGFLSYFKGHPGVPYYNPGKAKSLAAAGHCGSTPVTVKYNTGSADNDNLYNAVVGMMNAVGFQAKIDAITVDDWITVVSSPLNKTATQATRNGWQQDYPDPQDFISILFRCGNPYNIGQWCNSKFSSLVDRADVTQNQKTRGKLYVEAQKIALNNGVPVMLASGIHHGLIKTYVHGLQESVAYFDIHAKNLDWSKVYISKH